jgi:alcohol dehydrogenase (NADP+)
MRGPLRDAKGAPNPKLKIVDEYLDTWKSMAGLQKEGLVKHIGVSNFTKEQIDKILQAGLSKPVVNQIELYPYLQQLDLVQYCKEQGIQLMAYSPLGSKESYSGSSSPLDIGTTVLDNSTVQEIAKRHGKSVAQVLLRWSLQCGFVCIPKSANEVRIRENFQMDDCQLDEPDMNELALLDPDFRYNIGYGPGHFDCPNAPW